MAQSGKITEIVDVKAFEQIVRLQDELSKTSALMQTLSATTIQLANNTKNTTPKEAIDSTKKLAQTTDLLVETQKKRSTTTKRINPVRSRPKCSHKTIHRITN